MGPIEPLALVILIVLFANLFFSYVYERGPLLAVFFILALLVLPLARISREHDSIYLVSIYCLSLSFLLSASLISKNLIGPDINSEFYLFRQVLEQGYWQPNVALTYDTALSVTILPAVLTMISAVDGTWIFKLVFPMLFSFVPLVLFKVYRLILTPAYAFIAIFLFMSIPGYVNMIALGRQEIAELLLVLLVFIDFTLPRKSIAKKLVILILSFGIVVSHYSIAFVFVFLMLLSAIAARLFPSRVQPISEAPLLVLVGVAMVGYYLYAAAGSVLTQLVSSFIAISTGSSALSTGIPPIVQEAVIFSPHLTLLHWFSRFVQYTVAGILIIGFISTVRSRNTSLAQRKIYPLMAGCLILVLAAAAVPYFGSALNFSRFFQIGLLFASPLFPIGTGTLAIALKSILNVVSHKSDFRVPAVSKSLGVALVFLYLLFTSGWIWAITVDPEPTAIIFDWQRMKDSSNVGNEILYYNSYIMQQDIAAARWLKAYGLLSRSVCADTRSINSVLTSYGERNPLTGNYLPNVVSCGEFAEDYVFLSVFNTATGFGIAPDNVFSMIRISTQLGKQNVVYSGDTTVYLAPGN